MALDQTNSQTAVSTANSDEARTFPVDVEHVGIRVAIPVIIIVGGILLYLLISKLIVPALTMDRVETDDVNDFLSIVLAAIGGLALGAIGDRVLKRVWPSGRTLTLIADTLRLKNKNEAEIVLELNAANQANQPLAATNWRFKVRRSSPRAQSGWYMMAVQVKQPENSKDQPITFYSFLPPKQADNLSVIGLFAELLPRAELEKKNQSLRIISEQRRLEAVEDDRLVDGAELRPKDFIAVLEALTPHIPAWRSPIIKG
jgi:hypothetical protein